MLQSPQKTTTGSLPTSFRMLVRRYLKKSMEPDVFAFISDTLQNFEEIKNNRKEICIHHENTKKMLKVLKTSEEHILFLT